MKVNIEGDEWYPVWTITEEEHTPWGSLDVDEGTVRRWQNYIQQFKEVQNEISTLLDARDKAANKGTPR